MRSAGHATVAFASGEALLASTRLADIDCAVLDIGLGGMDGFALQQRLLEKQWGLPVALISGHGDAAMRQRAHDAGAIAFLRKPIKQVAVALGVSEITAKVHKQKVMKKMQTRSLADLARVAERLRIVKSMSR